MADPCGMCSFGGGAPSPTPEQQDRELVVISSSTTERINNCDGKQDRALSPTSLASIQEDVQEEKEEPAIIDVPNEDNAAVEEEKSYEEEKDFEDDEIKVADNVPMIQESTSERASATMVPIVAVPVEAVEEEKEEAEEPECDFDVNPTDLYYAMQKKNWDAVMEIIETQPTTVACWVFRKEKDGKLRWRLLPIHAALIFQAPTRVIAALLYAHPAGAAAPDDQGMVPLHLAFKMHQESDVVGHILAACPEAVNHKDRKGRTPRVLAETSKGKSDKRDAFLQALARGPIVPVAPAASEAVHRALSPPMIDYSKQIMTLQRSHKDEIESLNEERAAKEWVFKSQLTQLEEELLKTQQASEVLVDHVASLEDQLESRTETEKFLATRIVNLDMELSTCKTEIKELTEKHHLDLANEQSEKFSIQTRLTMAQQELAEAATLHEQQLRALEETVQEQAIKILALEAERDTFLVAKDQTAMPLSIGEHFAQVKSMESKEEWTDAKEEESLISSTEAAKKEEATEESITAPAEVLVETVASEEPSVASETTRPTANHVEVAEEASTGETEESPEVEEPSKPADVMEETEEEAIAVDVDSSSDVVAEVTPPVEDLLDTEEEATTEGALAKEPIVEDLMSFDDVDKAEEEKKEDEEQLV